MKTNIRVILVICSIVLLACTKEKGIEGNEDQIIHNDILSLFSTYKISKKDKKQKLELLISAFEKTKQLEDDPTKEYYFRKLSYFSRKENDSLLFYSVNKEAVNLAEKLKDTGSLTWVHLSKGLYFDEREIYDSAYYHYYQAKKTYKQLKDDFNAGSMLYNMAYIQGRLKDYAGAENNLFQSLDLVKKNSDPLPEFRCYNLLGIIYENIGEYELAEEYLNKALKVLDSFSPDEVINLKKGVFNNFGSTYLKSKDYQKALQYFNKSLEYLDHHDLRSYARSIDNVAYTRLLTKDTVNVFDDLTRALSIRDSLKIRSGIILSKLHLGEYYALKKDTLTAFRLTEEAYLLADEIKNNRDLLDALKQLSQYNPASANVYMSKYVKLDNEIELNGRRLQNKISRIQYETDEHIAEANTLSSQRTFIIVVSTLLLLLLSALYYIQLQNSKHKNLQLKSKNLEAEEEIYKLVMDQQNKLEEGRLNERERISRELHDGILGKLYGTRLGLGFLEIGGQEDTLKKYNNLIGELHQIEKEIRVVSHELKNDLFRSENSFMESIESLIKKQSTIGKYSYKLRYSENINLDELSYTTKFNCYRILQEMLLNINKHANANHVNVLFNFPSVKAVSVMVEDDGVGFDVGMNSKGIGLQNISQRVSQQRGEFKIESKFNQGTKIEFKLPK
ncbi:tetratricopeptide repeat protein [Mangrovimonas sp. YM274]|uniref:tetratricopeptide repeat-containing sensor histidine kinase n=1 Tax=Mangrovimonas sp. YM274 TaxID=3070660 RepID=UPI0027DE5466|nr:tetratricopeptide repeat protein [Mangrovimonas sp. YM274]WMI68163.1 tetratricopeptide repeat protein [Mangrovimonas sp. YM274]